MKGGIRAPQALESDLFASDIDIYVVSETHLKREIPDSVVAISNYTIYRRDRSWFGNDKRSKGGVAIYARSNIKVTGIIRSQKFECLCLHIDLPSGHKMLICGVYHPPITTYTDAEFIDYFTNITDDFLESNPNGLIVCGGDLNRLDLEKLTAVSGLKVLVDFATRGSVILDNCLTNNESLFSKCYPIIAQIKTDHKGIVLPPGAKLKPVRFKYILRDYREHRMNECHQKLLEHDWNNVNRCTNLDSAAECLQSDLRRLMAQCFSAKTVRMSSSDPPWISPLVKILLKKKAMLQARGDREADLQVLKLKINNLICNN